VSKVCKIINAQFSHILEVDRSSICFNGSYAADYFEEHYAHLGYEVKRLNRNSTFGYND